MPKIDLELKPLIVSPWMPSANPASVYFIFRATKDEQVVTLIVEKLQVQSLAMGLEQFMADISEKFPDLPEASPAYIESEMHIEPPVDPLFRVGELGLGYEGETDLMVLVAREILVERARRRRSRGGTPLEHPLTVARLMLLGRRDCQSRPPDLPAVRRTDGTGRPLLS